MGRGAGRGVPMGQPQGLGSHSGGGVGLWPWPRAMGRSAAPGARVFGDQPLRLPVLGLRRGASGKPAEGRPGVDAFHPRHGDRSRRVGCHGLYVKRGLYGARRTAPLMISRLFKFFETLVDPYTAYPDTDTPPRRLFAFLWDYSQPFKRLFAATAIMSLVVAAIEIGLIWYMGRVVDLLSTGAPSEVLADHGVELMLAALFVLLIRPLMQGLDVALLNNAILPQFGTLIRWRAHRQVLRQSVGWFENDFAGRIANRIMQTPPAAGEAMFQVFDAITFSLAYLAGAAILLAEADPRLAVPLLIWFALYGWLVRWTILRVGPASKAASDARSAVTGRVVDSYTNIHSVKMFAHHEREISYAKEAIEHARRTFQREMRIYTVMDVVLTTLNGLLIVGVVGWAVALWSRGEASVGVVAAAAALTLRLNAMTGWIMWAVSSFFRNLGVVAEGMETIAQPIALRDRPGAPALQLSEGRIAFDGVSHHYGRGSGGLD